ncbi:TIGR03067 domain-containing protein [Frigoriglobus tundricola]|uniref:TIGR03067 domain-containing protein n=1 Tax=Frigoriglobus tundricola TaxID=2774151 RepID=A0A6M5YPI4_9BACT|nr:TIGR03067 domain-containing protein [Frigoriglobus tundricola]QJW95320.1 hypothetical protein FTUN_2867 [Frigoriglobus tundricola]
MRTLTAAFVLALAGWAVGAADDPKDAAKKLEGVYEVLDVTIGGKPDPKKDGIKGVEIKNGEFVIKLDKRNDPAKFTLDPTQSPAHIDISPDGTNKVPGIYQVKETDTGTELIVVIALADKGERPKDFKGGGKDHVMLKLLRKKAK